MFESESILRDGFRLKQQSYRLPQDLAHLDPDSRKEITICNLFMNKRLGIQEIVRQLGESYGNVVHILINQGVVYERRKSRQTKAATADPRQMFFKGLH
jgi:hypothetical protein